MMRRMSNRLAARAALTSSSSLTPCSPVPGTPKGRSGSDAMTPSDEDDVQDDQDRDRDAGQQPRRAPPQLVARVFVLLPLLRPRQAPHQPAQLLRGLGLGEERYD